MPSLWRRRLRPRVQEGRICRLSRASPPSEEPASPTSSSSGCPQRALAGSVMSTCSPSVVVSGVARGGGARLLRLGARSAGAGRRGPGKPGGAGGGRRVLARALRHAGRRGGRRARCGVGAPGQAWRGEGCVGQDGVAVAFWWPRCRWGACCGEGQRASSGRTRRAAGGGFVTRSPSLNWGRAAEVLRAP